MEDFDHKQKKYRQIQKNLQIQTKHRPISTFFCITTKILYTHPSGSPDSGSVETCELGVEGRRPFSAPDPSPTSQSPSQKLSHCSSGFSNCSSSSSTGSSLTERTCWPLPRPLSPASWPPDDLPPAGSVALGLERQSLSQWPLFSQNQHCTSGKSLLSLGLTVLSQIWLKCKERSTLKFYIDIR